METTLLTQKALKIAITQLGVTESPLGSNSGPEVNQYLRSVGLNPGVSWCMAFIYWCFKNAAAELGIPNPAIKSGGVLNVWGRTLKANKSSVPSVGSIFIMDLGKGLGHTGIVERFDDDKIYTIEGNTNDTGSREGIEVCRRERNRSTIKGYINL